MDRAGEAPSPSTLNSVTATRADITPPWAEGGATGGTGVGGIIAGAVAVAGGPGVGADWTGATGAGGVVWGFAAEASVAPLGCARAIPPAAMMASATAAETARTGR